MTATVLRPTSADNSVLSILGGTNIVDNVNEGIVEPTAGSDIAYAAATSAEVGDEQVYTFEVPTTQYETISNVKVKMLSASTVGTSTIQTRLEINGDWTDELESVNLDSGIEWETTTHDDSEEVNVVITSLKLGITLTAVPTGVLFDEIYLEVNGELVGPGCLSVNDEDLTNLLVSDEDQTNLIVSDEDLTNLVLSDSC